MKYPVGGSIKLSNKKKVKTNEIQIWYKIMKCLVDESFELSCNMKNKQTRYKIW